MKPFKLRVDWSCHEAYGDQVAIELHIMDEDPKQIHAEPTIARAVDWALRFFANRGFGYWCDIDLHQRSQHTYITLHPRPLSG